MRQDPNEMTASALMCEIASFMLRCSIQSNKKPLTREEWEDQRSEWERHREVCAELDRRFPRVEAKS